MTTTATKISKAAITRKLNAKGFEQARWISNGVRTTEGFMTSELRTGAIAIDYYNNGGVRDIDDEFIARHVRKIANIATYLQGEGIATRMISDNTTGLITLIIDNY
jgi:hypothetical protein